MFSVEVVQNADRAVRVNFAVVGVPELAFERVVKCQNDRRHPRRAVNPAVNVVAQADGPVVVVVEPLHVALERGGGILIAGRFRAFHEVMVL